MSNNKDMDGTGDRVTLSSGYNFPKLELPTTSLDGGSGDKEASSDADMLRESSSVGWPVEKQIDLLLSMTDLKPVGCLRHWRVLLICDRMMQLRKGKGTDKEENITPAQLWPFLHEFYHSNCVERHLSDNGPFSSTKVKDFDPLGKSEEMAKLLEVKKKQVAAAAAALKEKEKEATQKSNDTSSPDQNNSEGNNNSVKSVTQKDTPENVSAPKCNNPSFTPITKPNVQATSGSASKRTNSEVAALNQANKSSSSAEVETPRSKLRKR